MKEKQLKRKQFFLYCFLLISVHLFSNEEIKITVFPFKPMIYQAEDGGANGFFYDLIEYIAKEEKIKTTYVFQDWASGLESLKTGEIDLMTSVAYTEERDLYMDYMNEPVFTVWSQVFSKKGLNINNIFDLENKKIGLMKNDFNGQIFLELKDKFNIVCEIIYFDNFTQIYQKLSSGSLDAGVSAVTTSYAMKKEYAFDKTPIIFNPFNLYFTVPKGKNKDILKIFENRIREMKKDRNSYYYKRLNFWIAVGESQNNKFNKYLMYGLIFIALVLFFSVLFSLFLKHKIKIATNELKDKNLKLDIINKKLLLSDQIINNTTDGVCITDLEGCFIRVNDSFCKMSGFERDELIGKNARILKSKKHDQRFYKTMWNEIKNNGKWVGEIWDQKKSGEIYPKWLEVNTLKNGNDYFYFGISSDITKIKKSEKKIRELAYYDSLTGIPNRSFFYEILEQKLTKINLEKHLLAILLIDLDRFKMINDTLGHSVGDKVLIEVSQRLKGIIKESDTIARIAGDEFIILLEYREKEEIILFAEKIISVFSKPLNINEVDILVEMSIGITLAPIDDSTVEGLVMKADLAMFNAKKVKLGQYSFYSKDIQLKNEVLSLIEYKIRHAIEFNEFLLYFQPKLIFEDGVYKVFGLEALIRMKPHGESIIMPNEFIKIAEDTRLIVKIGKWVIEEACRTLSYLKNLDINIHIAVNVSMYQLEDYKIIEVIKNALEVNNLSPKDFEIEITESVFSLKTSQMIDVLNEIKKLGVRVGIDDFGTGYSSLASLAKLPIDYLKIDKLFVDQIGKNDGKELVSSIVSIARNLNLSIIAEGVETEKQLSILNKYGTIGIQGYYFSKPLELDDFINFYNSFKSADTGKNNSLDDACL